LRKLESIPIAALGKIRGISLHYREGPKYKFPAASEDVAAVYQRVLKDHTAQNIGIYGCSAGGMLTAMSVAWFEKHNIPRPGAVGSFARAYTAGPINSPRILAKFPPALIITATRGFEMSGALYTHTHLVKLGVDAELHVWAALFHGFFYNPDVPGSRDCYDVIVKFFDRHLGQRS
jgi:acetyl esterase/lipase